MALRLSSALRNAEKSSTGFDIKFTEGVTYNLDELIANKDRKNSETGLVIEVKKSKEIAERAISELRKDILYHLNSSVDQEKLNDKLAAVVSEVFFKYNCDYTNIPEEAYGEINLMMTEYLTAIYKDHELKFNVYFAGSSSVTITAAFTGNSELNKSFSAYYDKFRVLYDAEMKVSEGGLAITDTKSKIKVNKLDYAKYLLSEEKSQTVKTETTTPSYLRAPVVIWEEGTEDTRTENPIETVYDKIKKLQDRVLFLENLEDDYHDE